MMMKMKIKTATTNYRGLVICHSFTYMNSFNSHNKSLNYLPHFTDASSLHGGMAKFSNLIDITHILSGAART